MGKKVVLWLIIATALVLIGCIIFAGAMTMLQWDFKKLQTSKWETHDHAVTEPFEHIRIITDTADIVFAAADNAQSAVSCREQTNVFHKVTVVDDTLVIELVDTRKWYEHIQLFSFDTPSVTVTLPESHYGSLAVSCSTGDVALPCALSFDTMDIRTSTGDVTSSAAVSGDVNIAASTGDIRLPAVTAGNISLSVSTGMIHMNDVTCAGDVAVTVSTGKSTLHNVTCNRFRSTGNTGDLALTNVIAASTITIERSTGDITLDACDAAELSCKTDTGDIKGTLLSDKLFFAQADTGRVSVPKTVSGGKCELVTDTGDIRIEIAR